MAELDENGVPKPEKPSWLTEQLARGREAGASWDDIQGVLADRRAKAKEMGYSDEQIDKSMGFNPNPVAAEAKHKAVSEEAASVWSKTNAPTPKEGEGKPKVETPWEGFVNGLQRSSAGLVTRDKLPDRINAEDAGYATHLAGVIGEAAGDIPAFVAGAIGGAVAGTAVAPGPGTLLGAGVGTFALPAFIKTAYTEQLLNGDVKSPTEFAMRQVKIWNETAKAGITGLGTTGAGMMAGEKLAAAGAGPITSFVGQKSAELAAMVTVSKALEKELPDPRDFLDAGIVLGTMHAAGKVSTPVIKSIQENLARNWVETNENPRDAAQRALQDPVFRAQLQAPAHPDRAGADPTSSATETPDGPFILTKEAAPDFEGEPIGVFHGSHAFFDQFRDEKIGSGEGAQIFSYGHYFAERIGIADSYREQGVRMHGVQLDPLGLAKEALVAFGGDAQRARASLLHDSLDTTIEPELRDKAKEAVGQLEAAKGFVYGVDINRGREAFIDWDKPISEQSEHIQDFARRLLGNTNADLTKVTGQGLYEWEAGSQGSYYPGGPESFTEKAKMFGIAGMKYLDASSRQGGKETQNFVVYDPEDAVVREAKPGEGGAEPFEGDALKAVRDRMAEPEGKLPLWQRIEANLHKMYLEMVQPRHPLRLLVDRIERGGPLNDADNPMFRERMAGLSNTLGDYMIRRGMISLHPSGRVDYTGRGLMDILGRLKKGDEERNFWSYAMSRWAIEKAAQAKETGVEVDAAMKNVADPELQRQFENTFQDLMTWVNGSFHFMVDAGMISEKAYQKIVSENKSRVPGYRWEDESDAGAKLPGKALYNPVKAFFGSDHKIRNILESLVQDVYVRTDLALRNVANEKLTAGLAKIGMAFPEGAGHAVKLNLTHAELVKLGVEGGDGSIWRILGRDIRKDQLPVIRDGKLEAWNLSENLGREGQEAVEYLRGFDQVSMSVLQKVVASFTKIQRNLIVMNPAFPIHLAGYDVLFQGLIKPEMQNTMKQFIMGLRHTFDPRWTPIYDQWARSGGAERIFQGLSRNDAIKDVIQGRDPDYAGGVWNTISTPWHALRFMGQASWIGLRKWGQSLNQAERIGKFEQDLAAGKSDIRAGVASSDAAFHSALFVGGPHAKALNSLIPFLTAHINSIDQTIKGMLGVGKTAEGIKFSAAHTWAMGTAMITMPMLANWYLSKDKEWYKAAPDWQKDNGLLFHFGGDGEPGTDGKPDFGTTLFYKMPPFASFIFGGVPRRLAEGFLNDNPHAAEGIPLGIGTSFLPPGGLIMYNALLPFAEHLFNHSVFRDQPLVSDATKRNLAPEQYTNYSTETGKLLSQWLNDMPLVHPQLAPAFIDNYLQTWSGTLGTALMRATDMVVRGNNPHQPAYNFPQDFPLLSSFTSRYPSASAQPIKDFTERMNLYQQTHGSVVKTLEEGNMERLQQIVAQDPAGAALHRFQLHGVNTASITPENARTAQGVLGQAALGADTASVMEVLRSDKAIKALRDYTKLVTDPETPQIREVISRVMQEVTGAPAKLPPGPLNPTDKRQLLDQAYGWMQTFAEHGISAMDKAKMK